MLFDAGSDAFESYKERNLYYKLFAGYLFNELIGDWETRFKNFISLLVSPDYPDDGPLEVPRLRAKTTHVSFDNHLIQVAKTARDRGEFADVLLFDSKSRVLIGVEAKFQEDWKFDKDVKSNHERLEEAKGHLRASSVVSVLLVTDSKWKNVVSQRGRATSQYSLLVENRARYPVRVLTWERVYEMCTDELVRRYLDERLRRTPGS